MDFNQWWKELTRCPAQWTSEERMVAKGAWDYQQMRIDELEAEKAELEKQKPVAVRTRPMPMDAMKDNSWRYRDCTGTPVLLGGTEAQMLYTTPLPPAVPECRWKQMPDNSGSWDTGCGTTCNFFEGGPVESGTIYCPKCGGRVVRLSAAPKEVE